MCESYRFRTSLNVRHNDSIMMQGRFRATHDIRDFCSRIGSHVTDLLKHYL